MKKKVNIVWRRHPLDHDYPAASSYLSLIYSDKEVAHMIVKLREVGMTSFKAKDIFRAS